MTNRPSDYLAWVPDGEPAKQLKPAAAQSNAGFTAGEPIPFQLLNYMFRNLDQWTQYLDQAATLALAAPSVLTDCRLINTGIWTWDATTNVATWSQAFNVAVPGLPDSANVIAQGNATIQDGQVIAATLNLPLTIKGTLTSGSSQITSLATTQGILAGQSINAPGVPTGTTVQGLAGNTVTMSQSATASASLQTIVFYTSTAPALQIVNMSSLAMTPSTVVLARRVGTSLIVGLNTGLVAIKDQETRQLYNGGYGYMAAYTAGVAIADRQPVFMALAGDTGLTAGQIYPTDASAANASKRSQMLGIALRGGAAGASLMVVAGGNVTGFSGLLAGATYYLDAAPVGAITATRPSGVGQPAVPVGMALSATTMQVAPSYLSGLDRVDNMALSGALSSASLATSAASGVLSLLTGTSIVPGKADTQDLGTAALPFQNWFGKFLTTTKLLARDTAAGVSTGPLVPDVATYNLGSAALPYANTYTGRIHAPMGQFVTYPLTVYIYTTAATAVNFTTPFGTTTAPLTPAAGSASQSAVLHPSLNVGSLASLCGQVTYTSTAAFSFSIQITNLSGRLVGTGGTVYTSTIYSGTVAANANSSYFALSFTETQYPWAANDVIGFYFVVGTAIPASTAMRCNATFNLTS